MCWNSKNQWDDNEFRFASTHIAFFDDPKSLSDNTKWSELKVKNKNSKNIFPFTFLLNLFSDFFPSLLIVYQWIMRSEEEKKELKCRRLIIIFLMLRQFNRTAFCRCQKYLNFRMKRVCGICVSYSVVRSLCLWFQLWCLIPYIRIR